MADKPDSRETERRMKDAHAFLSNRLASIAGYFTEPVKLTLVVRNPAHPDGSRDVCIGDDDFELAVSVGRKVLRDGVETKP